MELCLLLLDPRSSENVFWSIELLKIVVSNGTKILAQRGAILVSIAVPCFCRKKFPLNSKLLFVSIMLMRSQTVSVGGVLEVRSSRCNLAAWIPSV